MHWNMKGSSLGMQRCDTMITFGVTVLLTDQRKHRVEKEGPSQALHKAASDEGLGGGSRRREAGQPSRKAARHKRLGGGSRRREAGQSTRKAARHKGLGGGSRRREAGQPSRKAARLPRHKRLGGGSRRREEDLLHL